MPASGWTMRQPGKDYDGPRQELGYSPSRQPGVALSQQAPVEALDELNPGIHQHWTNDPVDKPRMRIRNVGVHPNDEVALQQVEALPERFALAAKAFQTRQCLLMNVGRHSEFGRNLSGMVGGVAVDQNYFIYQRRFIHKRALNRMNERSDGCLIIECGEPDAYAEILPLFEIDQPADIRKLAAVKSIFSRPLFHSHQQWQGGTDGRYGQAEWLLRLHHYGCCVVALKYH
jgi:hypothetical protein